MKWRKRIRLGATIETVWKVLKKLKIELPYDPAIPLLGRYTEKIIIPQNTHIAMFIAPLFTIARIWKQPKCSLTEEWIKKTRHIYMMEYYPAIKRNDSVLFAEMWMDLEAVIKNGVRKSKTNIAYMWNLEKWYR